jgi:hypothetical protein
MYLSWQATDNGVDISSDGPVFSFVSVAEIECLSPLVGPSQGGSTITVRARVSDGHLDLVCRFGETVVNATHISEALYTCVVPAVPAELAPMDVSVGFGERSNLAASKPVGTFQYRSRWSVQKVAPNFGHVGGTQVVSVTGNFAECSAQRTRPSVLFGLEPASVVTLASSTLILAVAPRASEPGSRAVEVSCVLDSGSYSQSGVIFTYITASVVTKVVPSHGPETGGTTVSVFGDEFFPVPNLKCAFGKGMQTEATFFSQSLVLCTSPRLTPGNVSVFLLLGSPDDNALDVRVAENHATFTYENTGVLIGFHPKEAPAMGGSVLTMVAAGLSLSGQSMCQFGEVQVEAVVTSEFTATCTVPALSPGRHAPKLIHDGRVFATPTNDTVVVADAAHVFDVVPKSGPLQGGTKLQVTGQGFRQEAAYVCIFEDDLEHNASDVVEAVYKDANTLICFTPPRASTAPTLVNVRDTRQITGVIIDKLLAFLFENVQVTRIYATMGLREGGTKVTAYGTGFRDTRELGCRFGNDAVEANWVSPGELWCKSPVALEGYVNFSVTVNGQDYSGQHAVPPDTNSTSRVAFRFLHRMTVSHIMPTSIPAGSSRMVTVMGNEFAAGTLMWCRFGTYLTSSYQIVSSTEAHCVTPASMAAGNVTVEVSPNRQEFSRGGPLLELVERQSTRRVHRAAEMSTRLAAESRRLLAFSERDQGVQEDMKQFKAPCNNNSVQRARDENTSISMSENMTACLQNVQDDTVPQAGSNLPVAESEMHTTSDDTGSDSFADFMFEFFGGTGASSVSPLSGPVRGGTKLTISGWGFHEEAGLRCRFYVEETASGDESEAADVDWQDAMMGAAALDLLRQSDDSVKKKTVMIEHMATVLGPKIATCVTPSVAMAHPVSVVVVEKSDTEADANSDDGGVSVLLKDTQFYFYDEPELISIVPSLSSSMAPTLVTITGNNMRASRDLACKFGWHATPATALSYSTLVCTTPSQVNGLVAVEISHNGQDFTQGKLLKFAYDSPTEAASSSPVNVTQGQNATRSEGDAPSGEGHETSVTGNATGLAADVDGYADSSNASSRVGRHLLQATEFDDDAEYGNYLPMISQSNALQSDGDTGLDSSLFIRAQQRPSGVSSYPHAEAAHGLHLYAVEQARDEHATPDHTTPERTALEVDIDAASSSVRGSALTISTAGVRAEFTITLRDHAGVGRMFVDTMPSYVDVILSGGPAGRRSLFSMGRVSPGQAAGELRATYLLHVAGEYELRVLVRGLNIGGGPFTVSVKHNMAFPTTCVATSEALESLVRASSDVSLAVHGRDAFGNAVTHGGWGASLAAAVVAPNDLRQSLVHATDDLHNGTYIMHFAGTASGRYSVGVSLFDAQISGSPFQVDVQAADPDPLASVVKGDGVVGGLVGSMLTFQVFVRDEFGNSVHIRSAESVGMIAHLGDGLLIAPEPALQAGDSPHANSVSYTYLAAKLGTPSLSVTLDGTHVSGSPFTIAIVSESGPAVAEKSFAAVENGAVTAGSQGKISVVLKDAVSIRLKHGGLKVHAQWAR